MFTCIYLLLYFCCQSPRLCTVSHHRHHTCVAEPYLRDRLTSCHLKIDIQSLSLHLLPKQTVFSSHLHKIYWHQCHFQDRWNYVQSLHHFLCWNPVGMIHSSLWLAWYLSSLCWSFISISGFLLLEDL